jgi:hypothetical protein
MPCPTVAAPRLTAAVPPATTSHHRFCVRERPIAKQRQYPRWRKHSPPEKTSQGVQADWCGQGRRPPLVSPRLTPPSILSGGACTSSMRHSGASRTKSWPRTATSLRFRRRQTIPLLVAMEDHSTSTAAQLDRGREGFDHDWPWWSVLHPPCSAVQAIILAPTRFPPISSRGAPPISLTNALLREGGILIRPARDVSYRTEERLAGSGSRFKRPKSQRRDWHLVTTEVFGVRPSTASARSGEEIGRE